MMMCKTKEDIESINPDTDVNKEFLHCAQCGELEEAKKLYKDNKESINKKAKNANGLTDIDIAEENNDLEMGEWLRREGFDQDSLSNSEEQEGYMNTYAFTFILFTHTSFLLNIFHFYRLTLHGISR